MALSTCACDRRASAVERSHCCRSLSIQEPATRRLARGRSRRTHLKCCHGRALLYQKHWQVAPRPTPAAGVGAQAPERTTGRQSSALDGAVPGTTTCQKGKTTSAQGCTQKAASQAKLLDPLRIQIGERHQGVPALLMTSTRLTAARLERAPPAAARRGSRRSATLRSVAPAAGKTERGNTQPDPEQQKATWS